MTDILQAAQSYYGLSDTTVRKSEWYTDAGKVIVCFEIEPTAEQFIGIADRMRELQEQEPKVEAQINWYAADGKPHLPFALQPKSREQMRADYDALGPQGKAAFGSFSRYLALNGMTVGGERDE